MAKEVTKANLEKFAKEELNGISEIVAAGFMKAEDARGRVKELFYLSACFGLGLQEEARKIERDLKSRLEK